MFCPSCGAAALPGQKFCTQCGTALAVTRATTPPVGGTDAPTPAAGMALPPPVLAPPTPPASTEFQVVEQTTSTWDATRTMPVTTANAPVTPAATPVTAPPREGFPPVAAAAVFTGVAALVGAFLVLGSAKAPERSIDRSWKFADFGDNLVAALVVGVVALVVGAVAVTMGRRWGSGLAGGAGLAVAGVAALIVGEVIQLIDATRLQLQSQPAPFTLTTTYDAGFYVLVGVATVGALTFLLSLRDAGYDGVVGNPAFGALGVLGTLAAVAGPLIPQGGASFGDNFSNPYIPPAALYLRLLMLALILVGGLTGFLLHRRWGYAVALGSISVGAYLTFSAAASEGTKVGNIGIAATNFIDDDRTPHAVTIAGVSLMLLAGLLALATSRRSAT